MSTDRFSRQSFLGRDSDRRIAECRVGLAGLGGGGSHVVQQLAHVGFQQYVLYDGDHVEESNLNRLVGATNRDALDKTPKLDVARARILGLQPRADIAMFSCRWQDDPEPLRECQIVIGCVDSYSGRRELEVACRRYLAHYIDIGMDVHGDDPPVIGGQIVLSSPGGPCLRCLGFLTDEKLEREASRYGSAGPRPQVVWANGVLASTAVGLAVELVTNWTRRTKTYAYLRYDGNRGTVSDSVTLRNFSPNSCTHYPNSELGEPILAVL